MQTDYRERHVERWYDSQWSFFWTVVGAMLTAGAIATVVGWFLMILAANYTLKSFDRVMSGTGQELQRSQTELERELTNSMRFMDAPRQPAKPEVRQRVETINHPPKSHEECMAANWGVIDENFQRCKRGWVEKRTVIDAINDSGR